MFWFFYISKIFDFFDTLFIILGKKWNQLTFLHLYHHSSICYVCWMGVNIGKYKKRENFHSDFWFPSFRFLFSESGKSSEISVCCELTFRFYLFNFSLFPFAGFDGDAYLTVLLNSFVHVIMYFYYLITSVGISVWWKPLLTYIQITQFIVMITQSLAHLYVLSDDRSVEKFVIGTIGGVLGRDINHFIARFLGAEDIGSGEKFPLGSARMYTVYVISMLVLFVNFAVQTYCCGRRPSAPERSKREGDKHKKE